jgi:hypothetical protein
MLGYATGDPVDMRETKRVFGVVLTPVSAFARR